MVGSQTSATNYTNFTKANVLATYPQKIGAIRQIRAIRVQEVLDPKATQRNTHHAPLLVLKDSHSAARIVYLNSLAKCA